MASIAQRFVNALGWGNASEANDEVKASLIATNAAQQTEESNSQAEAPKVEGPNASAPLWGKVKTGVSANKGKIGALIGLAALGGGAYALAKLGIMKEIYNWAQPIMATHQQSFILGGTIFLSLGVGAAAGTGVTLSVMRKRQKKAEQQEQLKKNRQPKDTELQEQSPLEKQPETQPKESNTPPVPPKRSSQEDKV